MWVLMKVHLVRNTINSFRRASRIMICSLVQHSPESHGIAVILNESAVRGSCWLHSLKGSSDLRTCTCFSPTVYSPPLLYRFGKCGLLQRLLGQAVQTTYSVPKSFNATEMISNSCFCVWQKVKAESIPVKNPCGNKCANMHTIYKKLVILGPINGVASGFWISGIFTVEVVIKISTKNWNFLSFPVGFR